MIYNYVTCKMFWKPRQFICYFNTFWSYEYVYFHFITFYFVYISRYTEVQWNRLTFVSSLNIIMFQLEILKNHSLVFAWYNIIQNHFTLETCFPALCLITAQMADIIYPKWRYMHLDICRSPTPGAME